VKGTLYHYNISLLCIIIYKRDLHCILTGVLLGRLRCGDGSVPTNQIGAQWTGVIGQVMGTQLQ